MDLGEGAGRAPFLLAGEEEADIVAVASASVALSQLTIIPSVPALMQFLGTGPWGERGVGVSPCL